MVGGNEGRKGEGKGMKGERRERGVPSVLTVPNLTLHYW